MNIFGHVCNIRYYSSMYCYMDLLFYSAWFSYFCKFLHHYLDLPWLYIPSSLSLIGFPNLSLVLGYGSLHLVLSVAGCQLCDDSWGIHHSYYRGSPLRAPTPLLLGVLPGVIIADCLLDRFSTQELESCGLGLHVLETTYLLTYWKKKGSVQT